MDPDHPYDQEQQMTSEDLRHGAGAPVAVIMIAFVLFVCGLIMYLSQQL